MANTKGNNTKKTVAKKNVPVKDERLGEGVADVAKAKANEKMQGIASDLVDMFFDYIDSKVKEIPDAIKRLRDNPKTKEEVATLWSEQLYEQGIIPRGYAGLPDDLLIHNFHQEGYLDGLYVGHLLTLVAMTKQGISQKDIEDVDKSVFLFKRSYEKRSELIDQLKNEIREYMNEPLIEGSEEQ